MIERCSKKQMVLGILALGGLSILIIILESRVLSTIENPANSSNGFDDDIHENHPVLKEKLSPDDKCWKKEKFEIVKDCDLCTDQEIVMTDPAVCAVSNHYKELVNCKESQKRTYRSCERVDWIEEQKFWKAELTFGVIGFFSGLVVYVRQKQLDHKMYQRIQKQIANSP